MEDYMKREWEDQIIGNFSSRDMDKGFQDGYGYNGYAARARGGGGGYESRYVTDVVVHDAQSRNKRKSRSKSPKYEQSAAGAYQGLQGYGYGHSNQGYGSDPIQQKDQRYGPAPQQQKDHGYGPPPQQQQQQQQGYGYPPQGYGYGPGPTAINTNNTTIINQPKEGGGGIPYSMPQNVRRWSTGLFGCMEDIGICLYGSFCAWCQSCSVAGQLQENCCVGGCLCGGVMAMRTKYRTMHGIKGDICGDCAAATCCAPLVIMQMAREFKNRPY